MGKKRKIDVGDDIYASESDPLVRFFAGHKDTTSGYSPTDAEKDPLYQLYNKPSNLQNTPRVSLPDLNVEAQPRINTQEQQAAFHQANLNGFIPNPHDPSGQPLDTRNLDPASLWDIITGNAPIVDKNGTKRLARQTTGYANDSDPNNPDTTAQSKRAEAENYFSEIPGFNQLISPGFTSKQFKVFHDPSNPNDIPTLVPFSPKDEQDLNQTVSTYGPKDFSSNFLRSFSDGFSNGIGSTANIVTGTAQAVKDIFNPSQDSWLDKTANQIRKTTKQEELPGSEDQTDPFSAQGVFKGLGSGVASLAQFGGLGKGIGLSGKALGLLRSPRAVELASRLGGMFMLSVGPAYEEALNNGLSEKDAGIMGVSIGMLNSGLQELLGPTVLTKYLTGGGSKEITKMALDELKAHGGELTEKALNDITPNLLRRVYSSIKGLEGTSRLGNAISAAGETSLQMGVQSALDDTAKVLYNNMHKNDADKYEYNGLYGGLSQQDIFRKAFTEAGSGAILGLTTGVMIPGSKDEKSIRQKIADGKTDDVLKSLNWMKSDGKLTDDQHQAYVDRVNQLDDIYNKNKEAWNSVPDPAKRKENQDRGFETIDQIFRQKMNVDREQEAFGQKVNEISNEPNLDDDVKQEKIKNAREPLTAAERELATSRKNLRDLLPDENGEIPFEQKQEIDRKLIKNLGNKLGVNSETESLLDDFIIHKIHKRGIYDLTDELTDAIHGREDRNPTKEDHDTFEKLFHDNDLEGLKKDWEDHVDSKTKSDIRDTKVKKDILSDMSKISDSDLENLLSQEKNPKNRQLIKDELEKRKNPDNLDNIPNKLAYSSFDSKNNIDTIDPTDGSKVKNPNFNRKLESHNHYPQDTRAIIRPMTFEEAKSVYPELTKEKFDKNNSKKDTHMLGTFRESDNEFMGHYPTSKRIKETGKNSDPLVLANSLKVRDQLFKNPENPISTSIKKSRGRMNYQYEVTPEGIHKTLYRPFLERLGDKSKLANGVKLLIPDNNMDLLEAKGKVTERTHFNEEEIKKDIKNKGQLLASVPLPDGSYGLSRITINKLGKENTDIVVKLLQGAFSSNSETAKKIQKELTDGGLKVNFKDLRSVMNLIRSLVYVDGVNTGIQSVNQSDGENNLSSPHTFTFTNENGKLMLDLGEKDGKFNISDLWNSGSEEKNRLEEAIANRYRRIDLNLLNQEGKYTSVVHDNNHILIKEFDSYQKYLNDTGAAESNLKGYPVEPGSMEYTFASQPTIALEVGHLSDMENDGPHLVREELNEDGNSKEELSKEHSFKKSIGLEKEADTSVHSVLSHIQTMEDIPESTKRVANELRELLPEDTLVKESGEFTNLDAWVDNSHIYLNVSKLVDGESSKETAISRILEEGLHLLTQDKLYSDELSPEEAKSRNRIETLFNRYKRDTILKDKQRKDQFNTFQSINEKLKKQTQDPSIEVTDQEKEWYSKYYDKLYPLTSLDEFVASGLSNPEFADRLGKRERTESYWQKLFNGVMDMVGIHYKNDFEALLDNTLKLAGKTEKKSEVDTEAPRNFAVGKQSGNKENDIPDHGRAIKNMYNLFNKKRGLDSIRGTVDRDAIQAEVDKYNEKVGYKALTIYDGKSKTDDSTYYKIVLDKSVDKNVRNSISQEEEEAKRNIVNAKIKALERQKVDLSKRITEKNKESIYRALGKINAKIENLKQADFLSDVVSSIDKAVRSAYSEIQNPNSSIESIQSAKDQLRIYENTFNEETKKLLDESLLGKLKNIEFERQKVYEKLKNKETELVKIGLPEMTIDQIDGEKLQSIFTKPQKNTNPFRRFLLDGRDSFNQALQLASNIIDKVKINAETLRQKEVNKNKKLFKDYRDLGNRGFTEFIQYDKEGKATGKMLNETNAEYDRLKDEAIQNKKYSEFLKDHNTIEISRERRLQYERDLKNLRDNHPDWEDEESPDYHIIEQWIKYNDPDEYKAKVLSGDTKVPRSNPYVDIIPNKEFLDPKYTQLMKKGENSPEVKLYRYLADKFSDYYKRYSNYNENNIPQFSKDMIEYMKDGDPKGAMNKFINEFRDSFLTTADPLTKENLVDEEGNVANSIPFYHLTSNIDPSQMSFNLEDIVNHMINQDLLVRGKLEAEPYLKFIREQLANATTLKTDRSGKTQLVLHEDSTVSPIEVPVEADFSPLQQLDYMLDANLYGKSENHTPIFKAYDPEGKKLLDFEQNDKKGLSFSSVADGINKFSRLGVMGLNAPAAASRLVLGVLQNLMRSTSREGVNLDTMMFGFGKAIEGVNHMSDTSIKNKLLMEYYQVPTKLSEATHGKGINPFIAIHATEKFIETMEAIGYLKFTKRGQTNLYDGWSLNADKTELVWTGEKNVSPHESENDRVKFINYLANTVRESHADMDSKLEVQKEWYGRLLITYKRYFAPFITSRFGIANEKIDGTTSQGIYWSLIKLKNGADETESWGNVMKNVWDVYSKNPTLEGISTHDKNNIRRSLNDFFVVGSLGAMGLAIKAVLTDDKDKNQKRALTFALNIINRNLEENSSAFNPQSWVKMAQNPVPALTTAGNAVSIMFAIPGLLLGQDQIKSGKEKGKSKILGKIGKEIPIVNSPGKIIRYLDYDKIK